SMWDTELMQKVGRVIGTEARAHGVHFVLSPVLGLGREPRWGRVEETYGEDPYLAAQTGLAMVIGMQGKSFKDNNSVVSEPKHYAIHSAPEGGINTASVRVGEREARESFLYVFETAIRKGNAHGVMAAYHDWDGIPAAADPFLLNELLRGEWGFEGMVLSDLGAVSRLTNIHFTVQTPKEAIAASLKAGLDMQFYDFPHDIFQQSIVEAVDDGTLTMAELDRAVASVLRVKFKLGLFENPYTDTSLISKVHHTEANQALALEAGQKAICLLKNDDNLLPFSKNIKSVAVVGSLADLPALGGYSPRNVDAVTILDGIRKKFGKDFTINFEADTQPMEVLTTVEARYLRTPDNQQTGLLAEYFNNPELEGKPGFSQVETHMEPYYHNNSPGGGIVADYFSVRWTGTITAPVSGLYELGIITDDKGRLFINDELLVDNWDPFRLNIMMTNEVHLEAGKPIPVRIEFAEEVDFAGLRFKWKMVQADYNALEPAMERILKTVKESDVTVLVVGENPQHVGEGKDKSNLNLTPAHLELAKLVHSAGKPVATVLLNGRPC
ncbi:MAG: glycoside hydrolase family 3 N-terminal domain-containing protein, partial [Calditrichota bacterium]